MPRKLKLQVQMTIDGFAAGPDGQLDWMTRNLDEQLLAFIVHLTDTSDTILLGRKMTPGFINYWESVKPDSPEAFFARKMVDYPKVVFSKTLKQADGKNVRVENGDLVQAVNRLKEQPGKDIVVYGGPTFVSSLLEHNLIDELNIFVNPVAIGRGMGIFKTRKNLRLAQSTAYACGVVVHTYAPGQ
ncbi:MAG: dihydrofolate reductase family protein [Gemmatimonadota bacterium]